MNSITDCGDYTTQAESFATAVSTEGCILKFNSPPLIAGEVRMEGIILKFFTPTSTLPHQGGGNVKHYYFEQAVIEKTVVIKNNFR